MEPPLFAYAEDPKVEALRARIAELEASAVVKSHAVCMSTIEQLEASNGRLRAENAKLEASRDTWRWRAMVWAPESKLREWEAKEALDAAKGEE